MPICLIGDTSVGKTSLCLNLQNKGFNEYSESTIGASFVSLKLPEDKINTYNNCDKMKTLEIWDTAGQERYKSLVPLYFRSSQLLILVLDFNSNYLESFKYWVKYVKEKSNIEIIVVFSKADLYIPSDDDILLIKKMLLKYQKSNDIIIYSSKTNKGRYELLDRILFHINLYYNNINIDDNKSKLMIDKSNNLDKPRYNCCLII